MSLGNNIRTLREAANMSPDTLARLIGVDVKTVGRWERGASVPSHEEFHFIACALNVEDDVLRNYSPSAAPTMSSPGAGAQKTPSAAKATPEKATPTEVTPEGSAPRTVKSASEAGVLGQPDGIYGQSDRKEKENEDESNCRRCAASGGNTEEAPRQFTGTPSQQFGEFVPARGERILWRGKPSSASKSASSFIVSVFILFFIFFMFPFIALVASLGSGEVSGMPFFIIWLSIGAFVLYGTCSKPIARARTDYYITSSRIVIVCRSRGAGRLEIPYSDLGQIYLCSAIVGTDGIGTIVFPEKPYPAGSPVPTPTYTVRPIPRAFFDIYDPRGVIRIIATAANAAANK